MFQLGGAKPDVRDSTLPTRSGVSLFGLELVLEDGTVVEAMAGREILTSLFWCSWGNIIGLLQSGKYSAFEPYGACLRMFSFSDSYSNNRIGEWVESLTRAMNQTTYGFLVGTVIIQTQETIARVLETPVDYAVGIFPMVIGEKEKGVRDTEIQFTRVKLSKVTDGIVHSPESVRPSGQPLRLYRFTFAEAGFDRLWNFEAKVPSARGIREIISQLELGKVTSLPKTGGGEVAIPDVFNSLMFPQTESRHSVLSELIEKSMRKKNKIIVLGKVPSFCEPRRSNEWKAGFFGDIDLTHSTIASSVPAVIMGPQISIPAAGSQLIPAGSKTLAPTLFDTEQVLRVLEYRTFNVKISKSFDEFLGIAIRTEGSKAFHLSPGKSFYFLDSTTAVIYLVFILSWGYMTINTENRIGAELELLGLAKIVARTKGE